VARPARMSLRLRLLIIALATLIAGTVAVDFATVTALRSFLIAKLDNQLASSIGPAARELVIRSYPQPAVNQVALVSLPAGSYGELVFANGASILAELSNTPSSPEPAPPVTSGSSGSAHIAIPLDRPVTIPLANTDYSYRVLAVREPAIDATMVLAIPMTSLADTIHRLELSEILVSVGVIVALGLIGAFAIQLGLAPLDRMRARSREITAGDSLARVDEDGPLELASLAEALNTMLERLQDAYQRSENSSARLRQFIADVSHELRTPLTSIMGHAELYLLHGRDDEEEPDRAMERILSESKRMAALIEDLLLLARMDQNRPLTLAPVNLAEVVREATLDAQAVEPDRPIRMRLPAEALVLGDEHRLTQVIANLLSNARTHTPRTAAVEVAIDILPRASELPPGAVAAGGISDIFAATDEVIALLEWDKVARLTVCDTGPGLESTQLARVFDRFYRSDESRSRAKGGAGLGLSLVAAIAQSHGGRAWAASAGLGRGACFGVDLPLLEMDADEPTPTLEPTPALEPETTGNLRRFLPSRVGGHRRPQPERAEHSTRDGS